MAKTYFCWQKLFLPVRFFPRKIPVFSTFWQKPANPGAQQKILPARSSRITTLSCSYPMLIALCLLLLKLAYLLICLWLSRPT